MYVCIIVYTFLLNSARIAHTSLNTARIQVHTYIHMNICSNMMNMRELVVAVVNCQ